MTTPKEKPLDNFVDGYHRKKRRNPSKVKPEPSTGGITDVGPSRSFPFGAGRDTGWL